MSPSGADPLDPGPEGFAHRGLHGPGIPENSLAAFRAALDFGAGIECDVRLSVDGEAMIVHDSDLRRLCDWEDRVESMTADRLAAKPLLGTDETIPRLSELLELVAGRVPLLVELKTSDGNVSRLAHAVASDVEDYTGPFGLMSLDPRVPRLLKIEIPAVRRGLVVEADLPPLRRRLAMALAAPDFVAVERTALDRRWVTRAGRSLPVYGWTIRTEAERAQAQVHADALIWEADGRPRS